MLKSPIAHETLTRACCIACTFRNVKWFWDWVLHACGRQKMFLEAMGKWLSHAITNWANFRLVPLVYNLVALTAIVHILYWYISCTTALLQTQYLCLGLQRWFFRPEMVPKGPHVALEMFYWRVEIVEEFKANYENLGPLQQYLAAYSIFNQFIATGAPSQINLSETCIETIRISLFGTSDPHRVKIFWYVLFAQNNELICTAPRGMFFEVRTRP